MHLGHPLLSIYIHLPHFFQQLHSNKLYRSVFLSLFPIIIHQNFLPLDHHPPHEISIPHIYCIPVYMPYAYLCFIHKNGFLSSGTNFHLLGCDSTPFRMPGIPFLICYSICVYNF